MGREFQRFEFDRPEGKVWVEILSAIEREDYVDGKRQRIVYPTLRVTTFTGPSFHDAPREFVKYRGRKYSIDEAYYWDGFRWQPDNRNNYVQYFQNESGSSVDWKSPVREVLRGIVDGVLADFVKAVPNWRRLSEKVRLDWQYDRAKEKQAGLFAEWEKAKAEADALRVRLDEFEI